MPSNKFIDDGSGMVLITPQCKSCKHVKKGNLTCAAFPEGIPQGILINAVDHRAHVKGDNGIKYERREDSTEGDGDRASGANQ